MKAYHGIFTKVDGSLREMVFVRVSDLNENFPDFISTRVKGGEPKRNFPNGMELVFDLECDSFRTFNWNTVVGKVDETEIADEHFVGND